MNKEITLSFSKKHKSIVGFEDISIPELTVVCGRNGSGKVICYKRLLIKIF